MLAFYARGDALVAVPGQNPFTEKRPPGSPRTTFDETMDLGPVRRVGRDHVPAVTRETEDGAREVVTPSSAPATREPFRVKETNAFMAQKLAKRVREKALWPADEHTAEFCGVPFVPVEFIDGEWVEKRPAKKSPGKFDAPKSVAAES